MKPERTLVIVLWLLGTVNALAQQPANPACHASFSADITSGCTSLEVHFNDESIPPAGDPVTGWQWNFGDGQVSDQQHPVHSYSVEGNYTVSLLVKTKGGWKDSLTRVKFIHAGTLLPVNLGRDTAICEGSPLWLLAVEGAQSYRWNTGDTVPSIQVNAEGLYWVNASRNGCERRDSIQVNTRPQLLAGFNFEILSQCLPAEVRFTDASSTCPGFQVARWQWDFGDGGSSTLQNPVHIYQTSDSFVVRLTVWDDWGFSMTRSKRVVVKDEKPMINLGNDTSICENQSLLLDAGNPGAEYLWSNGETGQTCTVQGGGLIWVRVTHSGCMASDTIRVSVNPAILPSFGFRMQGNCLPLPVQFHDSTRTCGTGIIRWTWDFGDGSGSGEQHPQHFYRLNGEYTVRLTLMDESGNTITKSRKLLVQLPAPSVNLGPDTTICFGSMLFLDAGNAGCSYLWSTGETTREIAVVDDGDYWVRVSNGGCEARDTTHITARFPVKPGFGYSIHSKCLPVAVQFTDSSITYCDTRIIQRRWDFGDGITSTESSPLHIYTGTDTFNVRLTVITSDGLAVSKSGKIFIENTIHSVNLGKDLTICKGSSVQLNAGPWEGASYQWTPSEGLSSDTIATPLAIPKETTTYTVSVTRCMITSVDDITIIVSEPEKPRISQEGNRLRSTEAASYQWYKNGEIIAGARERFLKPDGAGHYEVAITNTAGCESRSDPFFYLPTNHRDKWFHGIRVKCSPNPGHGLLNVFLSRLPDKPIRLTVIDRFGKRLFTVSIRDNSNWLNLTNLANGYYFLEFVYENEKITIPVVIQ